MFRFKIKIKNKNYESFIEEWHQFTTNTRGYRRMRKGHRIPIEGHGREVRKTFLVPNKKNIKN